MSDYMSITEEDEREIFILDGKKYDPSTSEELCRRSGSGTATTNHTSIFRKKNGQFWKRKIYYTRWQGDSDSMECIPLKIEEAKSYLETRIDVKKYEALFGPVEE